MPMCMLRSTCVKQRYRLIVGSKGGAKDTSPSLEFVVIFMQFLGKSAEVKGWSHPFRVGNPGFVPVPVPGSTWVPSAQCMHLH